MTSHPDATALRLVFGDDGSPSANTAWDWINHQQWPGWAIDAVTATQPDPPRSGSNEPRPWDPGTPRLPEPSSELSTVAHIVVDTDPRLALADRTDASLLVVGRGDLGRRFSRLLGSTAAALVSAPPAPLLIVDAAAPVERVLVGVDGSANAQHAVEFLCELPLSRKAAVTVLGVYDGWADTAMGIRTAVKTLSDHGIDANGVEGAGKAVAGLLEQAETGDIDLIVVGAKGLAGWDWLKIGSTAAAVAHGATCNVLIVPTQP